MPADGGKLVLPLNFIRCSPSHCLLFLVLDYTSVFGGFIKVSCRLLGC